MSNPFAPAVRLESKGRVLVTGPAGAGKTHTSIELAHAFGDKIAVIDTELDRALLAVDEVGPFDHMRLTRRNPRDYVKAIEAAIDNGYDVVVIDSLSHAWKALLQAVDSTNNRAGKQDGREGWRRNRPDHEALMETIVNAPIHIIATVRSKMEYDWEASKKQALGYAPIQDNELPFEFDLVIDMDIKHTAAVSKARGASFMDQREEHLPTRDFLAEYVEWLGSGAVRPPDPEQVVKERGAALVAKYGRERVLELMDHENIHHGDLADDRIHERFAELLDADAELAGEAPAKQEPDAPAATGTDAHPEPAPEPPTQTAPTRKEAVATQAQLGKLWATAKEVRPLVSDDERSAWLHALVAHLFNRESLKEIPRAQFSALLSLVEANADTERIDVDTGEVTEGVPA